MRRYTSDRVIVLVLGVAFIAGGLALVDWKTGYVLGTGTELTTASVADQVDASWWPWAEGAAGVLVALLGLWWLLAHLPRRGPSSAALPGSTADGEFSIDLGSLGRVIDDEFGGHGAVEHVNVSFDRSGGRTVGTVSGRLASDAELSTVIETAEEVATGLARVVPERTVHLQIQLGAPRKDRPVRSGRRATVRLQ